MTTGILLITLIERFGLLVAGAFILLSISHVHKLRRDTNSPLQQVFCILFFGLFGILVHTAATLFLNPLPTCALWLPSRRGCSAGLLSASAPA